MKNDVLKGNISIKQLFDQILEKAVLIGASDIHIDPKKDFICICMRVDGILEKTFELSKDIHTELIACIKIAAGLRTDVHTISQDGRFNTLIADDHSYNIRVSVVYTYFGENVVLRVLKHEDAALTLQEIGFDENEMKIIETALCRQSGLILVTGPTGSGKTTTLHAMLKFLSNKGRNIITIEDPIEFLLPHAKQIQINEERGITYGGVMKSVLRQDPNIIMFGEIRDRESAEIAMNSALTGHLILSSIHAIDAMNVIARLKNMGIDPYLLSATLSLVISQRLIRKLCVFCRRTTIDSEQLHFISGSCLHCSEKGFKGRICTFELLTTTTLKVEISLKNQRNFQQKAIEQGFEPREKKCKKLIEQGIITLQDGTSI